MEISINSTSEAVQFLYHNYLEKKYVVNRKYQRKLVWTVEEKEAFIDSLLHQYSVPLFLLAEDDSSTTDKMEIIDGLQRMNAICSFIENEFSLNVESIDYYFDLDTLADTIKLKDERKLTQREPRLKRSLCAKIATYPLPISKIKADPKSIEIVFRRINSYGRQLSEQEIRLAGAVGAFPDLVRQISSRIRGDVSINDRLELNEMQNISLSTSKVTSGIFISDIFWVRNNIITASNIRVSRDEELLSHILAYILLGSKYEPTKKALDKLYQYDINNNKFAEISEQISKLGFENIINNVIATHDIFACVAEEAKMPLRKLFCGEQKIHGLFRSYQILFLGVYDLYINKDLKNVNIKRLLSHFNGIGPAEFHLIGDDKLWNVDFRNRKIEAIKGIIKDAFSKDTKRDVAKENWVQQLENLLKLSKSEGAQYDFKQTCYRLDTGHFDADVVKKFVKSLVAGANNPNTISYIILGVADNKSSAEKYCSTYGTKFREIQGSTFFVTGIQAEVKKYCKDSFDDYIKKIKEVIRNCEVSEEVKQNILQNIKQVSYFGHEIIIFSLESGKEPYSFDDKLFIRAGNDCEELTGVNAIKALFQKFEKNKD